MNEFSMTRRTALAALGGVCAGWLPTVAAADPSISTASIVVGLAAGGATDAAARHLADGMKGRFATTVLVDNKTGAAARLAPQFVKAATPNGATLLLTPASMMAIYPHTYRNLGYDPVRDFAPVGIVATSDLAFAVGPGVPASVKTLADYLAWVKANPAGGTFGTGASGSSPHFLCELLARAAGVKMVHAGYRGSQPAILDLLGGHIPAVAAPMGEFLPHLKGGQLRVLAVTGASRSRFFPDVPTFRELGMSIGDMTEWFAVFAPAGTPAAVIAQVNAAMQVSLARPELARAYALMGMEVVPSTPDELAQRLRTDMQRWQPIVAQIGFTADT